MKHATRIIFMGSMITLVAFVFAFGADTYTTNYGLRLPEPGIEDEDTSWAEKINTNFTTLDTTIKANANAVAASSSAISVAVAADTTTIANSVSALTIVVEDNRSAVGIATSTLLSKTAGGTISGPITIDSTSTFTSTAAFNGHINISSSAIFSNATSTVTFSGYVDIGLELITTVTGPTATATATCPTDKKVIGGGCLAQAGLLLRYSYPYLNGWACGASAETQNIGIYIFCARVK